MDDGITALTIESIVGKLCGYRTSDGPTRSDICIGARLVRCPSVVESRGFNDDFEIVVGQEVWNAKKPSSKVLRSLDLGKVSTSCSPIIPPDPLDGQWAEGKVRMNIPYDLDSAFGTPEASPAR